MRHQPYSNPTLFILCLFYAFTSWGHAEMPYPANGKLLNNEPIIAYDDHFTTFVNYNGFIYVISNDIDYENHIDTSSLSIVSFPAHGTVQVYPDGSVYYTPANGFTGTDSFTYSICDDDNATTCDQATVSITVNGYAGINNAVIVNDDHVTTWMDESVDIDVLFNDIDPEVGIVIDSLKIMDAAAHGTTVINFMTGKILYTPDPGYLGLDTFVYRACDVAVEDPDSGTVVTCNEGIVTIHTIPSDGLSVTEKAPYMIEVYMKGDLLFIQSDKVLQGTASIYSSNGQLVLRQPVSNELPFNARPGVYFLFLETSQGIINKKIVHL